MKAVFLAFVPVLMVCACSIRGERADLPVSGISAEVSQAVHGAPSESHLNGADKDAETLEELAELERSGGFAPGMGIAESNLRERSGDYAGAVLAVFKELSWAYSRGEGGVSREAIAEGLQRVRGLDPGPGTEEAVLAALAFLAGRWEEAAVMLKTGFPEPEADAFSRWMALVCSLEQGASSRVRSEYSAIRARYAVFPEYWYRLARSCYALDTKTFVSAAAAHAERCINLAPRGPYAAECRTILAGALGLDKSEAGSIQTRAEIERLVERAVQKNNPDLLQDILPLVALPDNPYTLYASGVLRALAASENFRSWFSLEAAKSKGRLAERLLYIVRG